MSEKPLVSVIIPTYNRAHKIEGAIKSVLAQTYSPIQLIVVDDGSIDDTAAVVGKYPCAYIQKEHSGQAATRNRGLEATKGTIIASLDSDDFWNPDFLEKCVARLEAGKLDYVFTNYKQQLKNGAWKEILSNMLFLKPLITMPQKEWYPISGAEARTLFLNTCPAPSSSLVIRKSSLVSNWNEELNIADDWCLMLDLVLGRDSKAEFTMEQLWTKQVDDINIYDGRERFEVIRLLHVDDAKRMIERYTKQLAPLELKILERRYTVNLIRLSMYYARHKFNLIKAGGLMGRAVRIYPMFAFHEATQMLKRGFKNNINQLNI